MHKIIWKVFVSGLVASLLLLGGCEDGDDGSAGPAGPAGPTGPAGPVGNNNPAADAGTDQTASEGGTITLSGSGTDSDGSISAYLWAQSAGPMVTLIDPDTPTASFTVPVVDALSELVFQLTVTDDGGKTSTDSMTVTVGSAFAAADGINGGRHYSKFWAEETGFTLANSNLNDQSELDAITTRSDFFRCKQCHGWDRLGREGGYSNRAPKTSRPNVANVNLQAFVETSTNEELFDAIKVGFMPRRDISTDLSTYDPAVDPSIGDMMPDYSQILSDDEIWQIVKFLKEDVQQILIDGSSTCRCSIGVRARFLCG